MSLASYIRETKGELKHVSWPTRKQSIIYTVLVIAISVVVAAYLGVFDVLFTFILEQIII